VVLGGVCRGRGTAGAVWSDTRKWTGRVRVVAGCGGSWGRGCGGWGVVAMAKANDCPRKRIPLVCEIVGLEVFAMGCGCCALRVLCGCVISW